MTVRRTKEIEYVHRAEVRQQRADGTWADPVIRYHNPTKSREAALKRHEECEDRIYDRGSSLASHMAYSWSNCVLIKRATVITITETPVKIKKG